MEDELEIFQDVQSVAFVVRPLDSEAHNYISTMSPYTGLFTIRTEEPLPHNMELLPLGLGLFPRECVMRPWLRLSKDIKQILDLWEVMIGRGDKSGEGRAPVILTCGGKNSGKSTLNRHLINSALNVCKGVSYLELDIGQTEFSPPGCTSLHNVTEPVLGPPFTHVRKAERMCYFGAVSAAANVSMYVKCVEFVFAAHKGDNPLIINTMGWNKGIGLKLLVDILRITNPDTVVQMDTYKLLDNFPPVTPQFKMAEQGWLYNTQAADDMQDLVADGHELCVVQTPVMKMHEKFITWMAADHRNVTLLSYFCNALKPSQSLLSLVPYTMPWTALAVHVCDAAGLKPSKMLLVLNGSIVGLCAASLPEVKVTGDSHPRMLKTLPVCQCLGLGLVRGIDPKTKLLYIVTPLTQDELSKVNVLVKGSVTLPDQVTRQQVFICLQKTEEAMPYRDNLTRSIGSWKTNFKDRKMKRPGAIFRSRQK
ncbi:polynucleotide 5'-hydroxyl-kinase NOL9-like isoform X2 [Haliotis rubra]|uniref:polynucleotide 5'-hydroxyl-kinase NOL9-like isoform X2 n=1 Tax=Haliotis rubra TaxID=36100 RepID=UPI001EE4F8C3|nr:polynucleotide 5'-hydroxyl-kinase NOL9-like isoform X2 [Haliotis rubra]